MKSLQEIGVSGKYTFRKFANIHIPTADNIIIMSTPRSGSTMLMEMIAEQPYVLPVREPLNLRRIYIEEATGLHSWEEFYSENNYQLLVEYLQAFRFNLLVDARFKREKPFSHTWHPITNRLAYKILHGMEHKVHELSRDLKAKSIILLRHPVPVSLSREELPRFEAFLNSEVSKFFTKDQLGFAREIGLSGGIFEKSIVSWCFQNKLLLDRVEGHLLITYEELVVKREPVIKKVSDYLNLPNYEKMLARSLKPSGSSGKSSLKNKQLLKDVQRGRKSFKKLVSKWRDGVEKHDLRKAQEILDRFEIDIYASSEIMPSNKYLIL